MRIFFVADSHFGHANILRFCERPFNNTQEHDETLIENWNNTVGKNDFVYHLGDFCFGTGTNTQDALQYFEQLNGKIIMITGNHDRHARRIKEHFYQWYEGMHEAKIRGNKIVLCHYPLLSWNAACHGRPHLFGHCHSGPKKRIVHQPNSYDVGVDNNNFTPISYEEVLIKLEETKKLPLIY